MVKSNKQKGVIGPLAEQLCKSKYLRPTKYDVFHNAVKNLEHDTHDNTLQ